MIFSRKMWYNHRLHFYCILWQGSFTECSEISWLCSAEIIEISVRVNCMKLAQKLGNS